MDATGRARREGWNADDSLVPRGHDAVCAETDHHRASGSLREGLDACLTIAAVERKGGRALVELGFVGDDVVRLLRGRERLLQVRKVELYLFRVHVLKDRAPCGGVGCR